MKSYVNLDCYSFAPSPVSSSYKSGRKAKPTGKNEYTEINIKDGMPVVDDALLFLKQSLIRCRKNGYKCVLIIHGYGSTGKGGAINTKARQWLKAQANNRKIKTVIAGEDFDVFNGKARELRSRYPELEILLRVCNHGVTVVEL